MHINDMISNNGHEGVRAYLRLGRDWYILVGHQKEGRR